MFLSGLSFPPTSRRFAAASNSEPWTTPTPTSRSITLRPDRTPVECLVELRRPLLGRTEQFVFALRRRQRRRYIESGGGLVALVPGVNLSLSMDRDSGANARGLGVYATLSVPLGQSRNLSVYARRDDHRGARTGLATVSNSATPRGTALPPTAPRLARRTSMRGSAWCRATPVSMSGIPVAAEATVVMI